MRERDIERALKARIVALGGVCWKLVCPGTVGVPDRVCLMGGRIVFVEVKAPGETPRPIQLHRIAQLRGLGFIVMVIDTMAGIEEVADALRAA
ncbi:VRR-NUC domain-containing protein [Trueperella pyogenes]|uniref:VRR-NUC domain-containing protein n=1 Tax=Trueperella pyogenes TaxID=1661 RepID=UPI00345D6C2F